MGLILHCGAKPVEYEALKKFDSKGEKIPPRRTIDFLLDKYINRNE